MTESTRTYRIDFASKKKKERKQRSEKRSEERLRKKRRTETKLALTYKTKMQRMERLMEYVKNGAPLVNACQMEGVPVSKVRQWEKQGMIDYEAGNVETVDALWFLGLHAAQSFFDQKLVKMISNAAEGNLRPTETKRTYATIPILDEDGKHVRDQNGDIEVERILQEEVQIEKQPKAEWQAAAWLLEKLRRDTFGKPIEIPEMTEVNRQQQEIEQHLDAHLDNLIAKQKLQNV